MIGKVHNRIYEIRGMRVLIDQDLACLYEVETKVLNQSVKRNMERFPPDFMFQLTQEEWLALKTDGLFLRSHFVTSKRGGSRYLPYAFTEQGVAMLSGLLNTGKAIAMNIAIMRAFVEIRRLLLSEMDIKTQLKQVKEKIGEHDTQLNQIYDAMENLLDEKVTQKKWEDRERIGFRK